MKSRIWNHRNNTLASIINLRNSGSILFHQKLRTIPLCRDHKFHSLYKRPFENRSQNGKPKEGEKLL